MPELGSTPQFVPEAGGKPPSELELPAAPALAALAPESPGVPSWRHADSGAKASTPNRPRIVPGYSAEISRSGQVSGAASGHRDCHEQLAPSRAAASKYGAPGKCIEREAIPKPKSA